MGVHPSRLPPNAPPALVELDSALHIAKLTAVSALSIAVYDWIVCLDEEIEYIWKARNSVFKLLALFCRYMAIIAPLCVVVLGLGDWTREECEKLKIFAAVSSTLALLSVDYVLALRVVGIYCFQRNITIVIATLIAVQTALALWSSNYHTVVGIPPVIPGCFIRPGLGPRLGVSLYWFPAAVNNIVLLALTVVRIFPIWSNATEARWTWILLRDQIFYYGVITALSLTLHLLNFLGQNTLASVMVPLALTLPPVLVFHLVLNLRSIAQSPITSEREFEPILMEDLLATESAIGRARGTSETSGQTRRRMLSRENEETDFESRNGTFSRESNSGIEAPAAAAGAVPT